MDKDIVVNNHEFGGDPHGFTLTGDVRWFYGNGSECLTLSEKPRLGVNCRNCGAATISGRDCEYCGSRQ